MTLRVLMDVQIDLGCIGAHSQQWFSIRSDWPEGTQFSRSLTTSRKASRTLPRGEQTAKSQSSYSSLKFPRRKEGGGAGEGMIAETKWSN